VRKMGGGGRFVPLIGDTQQFSSISCCSTDKYEHTIQNSSNVTSQLFSSVVDELSLDEADDKIDDVDDDDSHELIVCDEDDDVDS
jgi:hypothetical protein